MTGTASETTPGTSTAIFGATNPSHGQAVVTFSLDCPDPEPDQTSALDIYIDPSGTIVDAVSGAPIAGSSVTLFRADTAIGPYDAVPEGSAIMSPVHRTNPIVTMSDGAFGWEVMAGFYVVRSESPGCTDPTDPSVPFVETTILKVEPAWTGFVLELTCAPLDTTLPVITIAATPATLWPPNGKLVSVTIAGTITDAGFGVKTSPKNWRNFVR